ncbi:RNA ligase family protein [Winogradskya consettensis]|uniref:2'-5' RNA ligase n=2 Tax=Winogradskya TaxID=3240235 RepID=A0A919SC88_9ACTN|nr:MULTISPECIES: RNA ligase family protein [Actinoplanes]GIE22860.1 2'-5' RNA ligase [Actinoplanes humidus]GIM69058.1 2'-5' RNA ligase [Actinoplanes consettensis]
MSGQVGKYPRTFHLPDSPGATNDDRIQHDLSWLDGELVVTEKLDGGNLTFTRDTMYARSLDSGTQPWDVPAKALWAMTAYRIPDDWRVCGESMWARRSIAYTELPGVFMVFGIWDETNTLLGWDDTVDWATRLELPVVPVLYRGLSLSEARAAWALRCDPGESEGFVVRSAGRIPADEFTLKLLKWVRPEHVRTEASWRHRDDFAVNGFA